MLNGRMIDGIINWKGSRMKLAWPILEFECKDYAKTCKILSGYILSQLRYKSITS
jgi:hypothetical protein